eukprot:TRINITY_DN5204_c0_g2_i1.p2 TRINITY_DN5204_c0_g2~~TRINITY_DN5204_c0_g2_i1.p2  ORF type:complete len:270 (-),score=39.86 TRINITY_DN5204_c0_g2_i1:156-965(-)
MDDNLDFDFEQDLDENVPQEQLQRDDVEPPDLPANVIGQQPGNFKKNFRKTVCTYWLKGLCMKGEQCGFLHQYVPERMPVCKTLQKHGACKDPDCPFKHDLDEINECNMYRLGFCIYGPNCRYRHTRLPGPPPDPAQVEAAKPREFRDVDVIINQVNEGISDGQQQQQMMQKRFRKFEDQPQQLALHDRPAEEYQNQQQFQQDQMQQNQQYQQNMQFGRGMQQQQQQYGFQQQQYMGQGQGHGQGQGYMQGMGQQQGNMGVQQLQSWQG